MKFKKIKNMSIEDMEKERNELTPMVIMMNSIGITEFQGINYWDIGKRHNKLCQEILMISLLTKFK